MLASAIPTKLPIPFADAAGPAYINAIPEASQIFITPGAASLTDGFPPLTFLSEAAGGIPPFGADFNGILNLISAWNQWQSAGGPVKYDGTFSTAIGGYPAGAVLMSVAGGSWWLSTTDNNASNPETGGANWILIERTGSYAGNPNTHVAGFQATPGGQSPSLVWDTTHGLLWVCTTTGDAAGAVWTNATSAASTPTYWCGTSAGSANAAVLTIPVAMVALTAGVQVAWLVGTGNTGPMTVQVGALGTFALDRSGATGPEALIGGELVAGSIVAARFDGAALQLSGPTVSYFPGVAHTGTNYAFTVANRGQMVRRSNSGSAMSDTLPAGMLNGWTVTVMNIDAVAVLTLTAPGGTQLRGVNGGTYSLAPGQSCVFEADEAGNLWIPVLAIPSAIGGQAGYINSNTSVGPGVWEVDTSAGAITVILSGSPQLGDNYTFYDFAASWNTHTLTIDPNGTTVNSTAGNVVCDIGGFSFALVFKSGNYQIQ